MKNPISPQACALIDLHLHLDGSLSVRTVRALAQMQGVEVPKQDEELLKILQVDRKCSNLNEYLEKFDFPCSLLQEKESISLAVFNLEEELREQGLIYAEIRFAPQLHTRKGLTQAEVVEAAVDSLKRSAFHCNLILCCMRGQDNHAQNCETVKIAAQYMGKGVCAIDLAGAEALYATENFEDLFQLALEISFVYNPRRRSRRTEEHSNGDYVRRQSNWPWHTVHRGRIADGAACGQRSYIGTLPHEQFAYKHL